MVGIGMVTSMQWSRFGCGYTATNE
jgi:hypothetical protein